VSKNLLLGLVFGASVALSAVGCGSDAAPKSGDDTADDDTKGDAGKSSDAGIGGGGKIDSGTKLDASIKSDGSTGPGNVGKDGAITVSPAGDGGVVPGNTGSGGAKVNGKINLAIPAGTALDRAKSDTHPSPGFTPPMGWNWYNIDGAKCRDGSPMGIFAHFGEDPEKLLVYFEGGGACANKGFCDLNPKNVSEQFLSGGESAVASLVILPQPQGPNGAGVFDLANADNPFKGWSQVFIPYCTGDVYSGTRSNVTIEGVDKPQNFYGAANVKLIIARLVATFQKDLKRFVAGGSSAGGFGAGINFGALQDSLPDAFGTVLLDASPPFTNDFMPSCLQQRWRDTWGIDGNYPADCGEQCRSADGGNLFQILDYWREKYPKTNVALISGIHDEIIRLFYSLGNDDCKNYAMDPPSLFIGTIGQTYDPDKFNMGLTQLRTKYVDSKQLATFFMDGLPNGTAHQCLFRDRFYSKAAGDDKPTIAAFIKSWIAGELTQVGP
jgi:hypothetical protein